MTDTDRDTDARGPIGSYALKHDYTFLVADSLGDVRGGVDGLFRNDTRMLSRFRLTIGGALPALLGSGWFAWKHGGGGVPRLPPP